MPSIFSEVLLRGSVVSTVKDPVNVLLCSAFFPQSKDMQIRWTGRLHFLCINICLVLILWWTGDLLSIWACRDSLHPPVTPLNRNKQVQKMDGWKPPTTFFQGYLTISLLFHQYTPRIIYHPPVHTRGHIKRCLFWLADYFLSVSSLSLSLLKGFQPLLNSQYISSMGLPRKV